jgi:hypothetical protein
VKISNRFAALENLDNDNHDDDDISRAWETVTKNTNISAKEKLGYYELKQCKPCFEEGCSELSDQSKQTKL